MTRRVNLIPLAGAGQRFVDAGYTTPKPLIPVAGEPMIVHAARSLPPCDQWIFVCLASHVEQHALDRQLVAIFPGAEVVTVPRITDGQARTCLAAAGRLRPDDLLTIGACDNAMSVTPGSTSRLAAADAHIWTFRHNPAVLQNPRMYGWVDVDETGRARRVSVKVPLSDAPMNDHAVIGAFTFRRAADFVACAERMIAADRRVNGEFYVDEVMNVAIESALAVKVLEVDRYICWGTPRDLETYEYWRGYFAGAGRSQIDAGQAGRR